MFEIIASDKSFLILLWKISADLFNSIFSPFKHIFFYPIQALVSKFLWAGYKTSAPIKFPRNFVVLLKKRVDWVYVIFTAGNLPQYCISCSALVNSAPISFGLIIFTSLGAGLQFLDYENSKR